MSAFHPFCTLAPVSGGGTYRRICSYTEVPVFYFHLHNDVDAEDHEGKEFPDLAAAGELRGFNATGLERQQRH